MGLRCHLVVYPRSLGDPSCDDPVCLLTILSHGSVLSFLYLLLGDSLVCLLLFDIVWWCSVTIWMHIPVSTAQVLIPDHGSSLRLMYQLWSLWFSGFGPVKSKSRFRTTSATDLELAGARHHPWLFGTPGPFWADLQRSQLCGHLVQPFWWLCYAVLPPSLVARLVYDFKA